MSAGEKHDSWLKVEIPSQYQPRSSHFCQAAMQCLVEFSEFSNNSHICRPKKQLWLVEISNFRRSTTAHCPGTRSAARPGRLEPWKTWTRIQHKSLYGSNFSGCLDVCVCCICHCFWVVIWYNIYIYIIYIYIIYIYNIYIYILYGIIWVYMLIYVDICWYMLIFVGRVVFLVFASPWRHDFR